MEEAEAARDFAKVMEHVRAGDSVRLERNGTATALIQQPEAPPIKPRPVEEVIARLRAWEQKPEFQIHDPTFADDLQAAHDSINQPLDTSRWD